MERAMSKRLSASASGAVRDPVRHSAPAHREPQVQSAAFYPKVILLKRYEHILGMLAAHPPETRHASQTKKGTTQI
jgi:hypothetical protein